MGLNTPQKSKIMKVQIGYKNWTGRYSTHVRQFNDNTHLTNWLKVMNRDHSTKKIISVEVLK
jgi:hypothetical protein